MPNKDGNITFGVVGLGMGANRAGVVAATEGAKLIAVCDLREDRAKGVAEQQSCDWYLDYEKMLERDDIDVIYVMTFSGLHADHGIMAAKAGKHVISTKPLDVRVDKVDELINECASRNLKLVADFDVRYSGMAQTMKNAVDSGALGRIILGEARMKWFRSQAYYDENGGWRGTWALDGGGSMSNQGIHLLDQLCWMMGDIKSVYADLGVYNHDIEGEDMGMALLTFANGAKGAIVGTTTFPTSPVWGLEVHGDKGAVTSATHEKGLIWYWPGGQEVDPETLKVEPEVKSAAEDMVRAIKEDRTPFVPGEEGRKSVVLLEALRKSSETGQVVTL
jgi:UDP-N-acetyl-2-amino-2-deoxyglucuronate dehydrogenase